MLDVDFIGKVESTEKVNLNQFGIFSDKNEEIINQEKINKIPIVFHTPDDFLNEFNNHLETCQAFSSSVFRKFNEIKISSSKHKQISGKSYFKLPLWLENKQCCVNMKNNDEKCFFWCMMAYLHYEELKSKRKTETRHYKKFKRYSQ